MLCTALSIAWWFFMLIGNLGNERIWNSFFIQYLWEFSLGMNVADHLYNGEKIEIHKTRLFVIAASGLVLEAILGLKGGMFKVFNDVPALLGYGGSVGTYVLFWLEMA